MPIATNDIYQARLRCTYQGKDLSNVFWFRLSARNAGTPKYSDSLSGWFAGTFALTLRDMLHESTNIENIEVVNWRVPDEDYDLTTIDVAGASSGEGMPPFVTATFRSARPGPGSRYSYKRFGGIGEGLVANGVPAGTSAWEAVKTLLNDIIDYPDGGSMQPVQVKHQSKAAITPENPTGNLLPPLGTDNPEVAYILNFVWSYFVGSQNSRKF